MVRKKRTPEESARREKILSMYAKCMTTGDIEAHIQDIYGIEVSDSTVGRITNKILPVAREWQRRPLEAIYAVVFLDAIHYHVRNEGQIVKKAVYIDIGIDLDGRKDVLGMWVGENESAKFWATVLNGLKNRSVEDIFIACTDNLTGFDAAIHAAFPQTEIQNCIVHQLRNSSKYVSYKDLKALMSNLKAVYAAVDEQAALDAFGERWDKKYPNISQSWRTSRANLSTYFKYPQEVRKLIYTTNAIEGFNRQLRKVTKAKSVFPTDDSLLKMLYLAMVDITKKWTGRRREWGQIHAQLAIFFAFRQLSQQRHTARELIDLFPGAADGNAKILQGAFGDAAHLLSELVIGLTALGQIGEIHDGHILKIRLVQLFPDLADVFRRSPKNGNGKFDNAKMLVAVLIGHIAPHDLRHFLPQGDPHDCRRICDKAPWQAVVNDHDALFILPIHFAFPLFSKIVCSQTGEVRPASKPFQQRPGR